MFFGFFFWGVMPPYHLYILYHQSYTLTFPVMIKHVSCIKFCFNNQVCDLTKVKKSWKMGSGSGCPFGLEDKAPWTSWMFNLGGITDSPHPHQQETRGLDTIQATSFFPWWLHVLLFFQEHFEAKGNILFKSWNQEVSWEITGLNNVLCVRMDYMFIIPAWFHIHVMYFL